MKNAARLIAIAALLGTIVPPLLFLFQTLEEEPMKLLMLISALAWFGSAPFVMGGDP